MQVLANMILIDKGDIMLEQVWKNVAGNEFDARVEKGEVNISIPRGSGLTVHDFGKFINRLENALDSKAAFTGRLNEEGLVEICLKFSAQPKELEEQIEKPKKRAPKKEELEATESEQSFSQE